MTDEQRLLSFFRCLMPADQDELLQQAGIKAMYRCAPNTSVLEFLPCVRGVDPNGDEGIFEIIRDGMNALGEPEECALGSSHFDESTNIPRFAEAATETAFRRGHFFDYDEDFARTFLRELRVDIASYCESVASNMATTVAAAESQKLVVPDSVENWIRFALTLDGERIAAELDWDAPGTHDVDLPGTLEPPEPPITDQDGCPWPAGKTLSPVLGLRLALYDKLRFLQKNDELPPTVGQPAEIKQVLDRLRDMLAEPKT